jgi:hypothetical protein
LERLEAPLDLTPEKVLAAAGPATAEIGDAPVWTLGEKDLVRLAHAFLTAAVHERRNG